MLNRITLAQKQKYLEKLGYTLVSEQEYEERCIYENQFEQVSRRVINCYYNGEKMAVHAGYGTTRVEYCFENEFIKRLLDI